MTISMELEKDEKSTCRSIQRTQYPITGSYAFTDYRSQGQTISHALVDIGPPPHGTLSLFNLYVALSRSPGRDHIRLLRDFKDEMLLKKHDTALLIFFVCNQSLIISSCTSASLNANRLNKLARMALGMLQISASGQCDLSLLLLQSFSNTVWKASDATE